VVKYNTTRKLAFFLPQMGLKGLNKLVNSERAEKAFLMGF
jgi:hypothetical protein